jgi:DNA-binding CsgD family transcriptional regulator
MGRLRRRDIEAMLGFVREISSAHDIETFRSRLTARIVRVVPADVTTYFEIDYRRRRLATVVAHPHGAPAPAVAAAVVRSMHQLPLFSSYTRGNGSAVKVSDFLTRRQFHRLALYDGYFRPMGLEHQMAKGLPGPDGLVTGIAVSRRRRDFSEDERLLLNLLGPHLNDAYRSAQALADTRDEVRLLRQGFEEMDRGLAVVDAAGGIRVMTTRARQWVTDYFGRISSARLPDTLHRWIEYDEAVLGQHGTRLTPRAPLIAEREGRCLRVRIVFDGDQRLLLLDERRSGPDAQQLEQLSLSRREAEVLAWVAQGKTNSEIGVILGASDRTVEKHVEHIFRKLGVETRTAAAACALTFAAR